eukprot:5151677-Lingulodinium_polyedra.AAC.1
MSFSVAGLPRSAGAPPGNAVAPAPDPQDAKRPTGAGGRPVQRARGRPVGAKQEVHRIGHG